MTDELGALGEFGLVDRIAGLVGSTKAVVGIGDDAALLDIGGPDYLLATVDIVVQGVHFSREADPEMVGRLALAVNLSDIAAMGGTPTFALVSLALPGSIPLAFVDGLYRGLVSEAARFEVGIVGGNISTTSGPVAADVTLLGRVPRNQVLLRSGAKPGDVLAVSGFLGARAAQRLRRDHDPRAPRPDSPEPRIALGRELASRHLADAAIDVSDGLGSDVHHLAERSEVGAVLYETDIPIASVVTTIAGELGVDPFDLALYGGEDYELLLAIPKDRMAEAVQRAAPLPLYRVGEVVEREHGVVLHTAEGRRTPLRSRGWTHF